MAKSDPRALLDRLRGENALLRAQVTSDAVAVAAASAVAPHAYREAIAQVRARLAALDVRGALAVLNATTSHRFTAIYRFDGEMLVNLHVFDREATAEALFPTIPITASYCMYVRDPLRYFALESSLSDPRTAAHPKREMVRSYCGIAILDEDDTIFGSLCHFDYAALPLTPGAFDTMEEVGRVLRRELMAALLRDGSHARVR